MTLNGVMAVILRYFSELVYDVVVKHAVTLVSKIFNSHAMTILKRSAQLFSDYLGKTN